MVQQGRIQLLWKWLNNNTALIALVVMVIIGAISSPYFVSERNMSAILFQYSVIGFLALGQLLVILTGGIDLSQGSQVALTSIITAVLMSTYGPMVAVLGAVVVIMLLGLINGILIAHAGLPPFVVTLGMLGIARGLAMLIANARPVPITVDAFSQFGRSQVYGVPTSALLWLACALILFFFLSRFRLGRYIYAVGSNEESARLSGINVKSVKIFAYILCSLLTALGGVLWAARLGSGSPIGGSFYELESIAAVLVGGGSFFGGIGTVLGTVAGVLIFGTINSILNLLGVSPFLQGAMKGVIILLAVVLSQVRRRFEKFV